jgi:hypothetical protein
LTDATFGKSTRGKKSESAAGWTPKIKNTQNIGDSSDRDVAKENLSHGELAVSLKFAGGDEYSGSNRFRRDSLNPGSCRGFSLLRLPNLFGRRQLGSAVMQYSIE